MHPSRVREEQLLYKFARAEGVGLILFTVLLVHKVKGKQHPGLSLAWVSLNFGSTLFTYTVYCQHSNY